MRRLPARVARPWLEPLAAVLACTLVAVLVSRQLLQDGVYSADAFVHQYWMRSFADPELFGDPLTAELRESSRYPVGYEALFRLVAPLADPIAFGEWLGVALMALSALLLMAIVREQQRWWAAAWIGAALFLVLVDVHRFHGGFPRAFVHPVVLGTALLSMRGHRVGAALVAGGGGVLYPPAAALAAGVLVLSAVGWEGRRPRIDRGRAAAAGLALALTAACVLVPAALAGGAPRVLSADEARAFPEFGPHGTLRIFTDFPFPYLTQNRTGFDLRISGGLLALAALALLVLRPANVRLLRREVLVLPVVAIGCWALAQAVLFQLYLPHRYTYPLVAFCAIVVAVALKPTAEAVWARRSGELALAAAAVLGALMVVLPGEWGRTGTRCPGGPAIAAIAALPKDAIVAGDPIDLTCLPATTSRAVVTSTQLAPAYEAEYFRHGRARMFATLRAVYGSDRRAIAALGARYGVTHLWIRGDLARTGARWKPSKLPYGRFVARLRAQGAPASARLPAACRTWSLGAEALYDVACITESTLPAGSVNQAMSGPASRMIPRSSWVKPS